MSPRVTHRIDEGFIVNLCNALVKQRNGAVLVFLPGKMEIESLLRKMRSDKFLGNQNNAR